MRLCALSPLLHSPVSYPAWFPFIHPSASPLSLLAPVSPVPLAPVPQSLLRPCPQSLLAEWRWDCGSGSVPVRGVARSRGHCPCGLCHPGRPPPLEGERRLNRGFLWALEASWNPMKLLAKRSADLLESFSRVSEGLWSWGGPQRVRSPRAGRNVGVSTSACMHTHTESR